MKLRRFTRGEPLEPPAQVDETVMLMIESGLVLTAKNVLASLDRERSGDYYGSNGVVMVGFEILRAGAALRVILNRFIQE